MPNVTAFVTGFHSRLIPIHDGTRDLAAGAVGTAQLSVTPDGRRLVVSERVVTASRPSRSTASDVPARPW